MTCRIRFIALLLLLLSMPIAAQLPPGVNIDPKALLGENPLQEKQRLAKQLEEQRSRNDAHGEAITLLLVGMNEMRLSNVDDARKTLQDTVPRMEAHNDTFGAVLALFVLSHLEQALGNSTEALSLIEQGLAAIKTAKTSRTPFTLKTLIVMGTASGLREEDLAMLELAADMIKPMLLQYMLEPIIRDHYGSLLTTAGQFDKAEQELNAAMAGSKYFQGMFDFSIAGHFGDLRFRQGRYDEARAQYQKALSGSGKTPFNPMGGDWIKAGIYDRLARLEMVAGRPDDALRWNDKSLEIARASGIPLQESVTLATRGQLLTRSERVTEAQTAFNEAMKIAVETKNVALQASIYSHMGTLSMVSGNYGAAASHLEKAAELERVLNVPASKAATLASLANAYMLTDNFTSAENTLGRARELVQKSKFKLGEDMIAMGETWLKFRKGETTMEDVEASLDRFIANPQVRNLDGAGDFELFLRHTMKALRTGKFDAPPPIIKAPIPGAGAYEHMTVGLQQFARGEVEAARRTWRDALAKTPSGDVGTGLMAMVGASYWREGNVEQAAHWFGEATKLLDAGADDLRSEAMLAGLLGGYHRAYYDILIETLVQGGKIEQAFEASERARARAFLRTLGNHKLRTPSGKDAEVVKEAEALRRKIANWDKEPVPGELLVDLRRRYDALRPRVQAAAEYVSLTTAAPLELQAIRKELSDDTTLISYFTTPFGIHAWILDRQSLEHVRLRVSGAQMRRVTCWAFELSKPRSTKPLEPGGCSDDPATPAEAYRALIAPLQDKIKKPRLLIVPHGELHYVPFAALFNTEKGYLIQNYPISYAPSAGTLQFLRAKQSELAGGALVIGDPEAAAQTRLPGAKSEAEKVAERFSTTAKLGKDAHEGLLYELRPDVDLLHIAAHATYDPVSPLFSAIHLAEDGQRNGQLNVDEIQSEINLKGVNLVVLSACQTGVGARSGGDEVVGLTRAIIYAGSPAVISTLWNISDEATPPLIEKFYDRLLAGDSASDALRAAQMAMLKDEKYADPRYWAAFLLTGDSTAWKKGGM